MNSETLENKFSLQQSPPINLKEENERTGSSNTNYGIQEQNARHLSFSQRLVISFDSDVHRYAGSQFAAG